MTDRYTKAVLTIIAVCLIVIAAHNVSPTDKAKAQDGPVRVIVVQSELLHVEVDNVAPGAMQSAGPLQVRQAFP
jgi:hypothetical protein